MKRVFFWSTIAAGVAAAYMMRKRGESYRKIAAKTLISPIGSFVSEVKTARA